MAGLPPGPGDSGTLPDWLHRGALLQGPVAGAAAAAAMPVGAGGALDRAAEFARRLIRAQHGISFMIECRVDSIDDDVFRLPRQAGLARASVGVETVNPQQLTSTTSATRRPADGVHISPGSWPRSATWE